VQDVLRMDTLWGGQVPVIKKKGGGKKLGKIIPLTQTNNRETIERCIQGRGRVRSDKNETRGGNFTLGLRGVFRP